MTQIDLELKSMAKSALREYISSRGAIDWEQRRYEIAKDVLCACFASCRTDCISTVDYAVSVADELISVLKEGGEK
jgi:hypothetical protein